MLETFTRNKKIWLMVIFVIIILVLLFVAGGYYSEREDSTADEQVVVKEEVIKKEAITEETLDSEKRFEQIINTEKEKCMLNFDLNNLDFTKPTWGAELSTMLKGLLVMRAVDQKNRDLCNYEKREIDSELRKERCERDYDFFFTLTRKLEKGLNSQQYVTECREALTPYILIEKEQKLAKLPDNPDDLDELKKGLDIICESYYISFQNKEPVILNSALMCDGKTIGRYNVLNYTSITNQKNSCIGEFNDDIEYLIAVAKKNPGLCELIPNYRTYQYCKYYFSQDLSFPYNGFKESYCHEKIHNDLFLSE